MDDTMLTTDRLVLRRWRHEDLAPFAALNADPEVMRYFPTTLTRQRSDEMAARLDAHLAEHGWGLWALETRGGTRRQRGRFAGFTGLSVPTFDEHFTPAVEVGWRLARWAWGNGFATEAAQASLTVGFETLGLTEIVSFASALNRPSSAVMERIGMRRDPLGDFEHPAVEGPLRRHVLYRLTVDDWRRARDASAGARAQPPRR